MILVANIDLANSKLVMVFVVHNMDKVTVERTNIIKPREFLNNGGKLIVKVLPAYSSLWTYKTDGYVRWHVPCEQQLVFDVVCRRE